MDSFFEQPRMTPKPTPAIQNVAAPTVPEVSLMFSHPQDRSSVRTAPQPNVVSYNAWKLRNDMINVPNDSITFPNKNDTNQINYLQIEPNRNETNKSLLLKKQVRFESKAPNGNMRCAPREVKEPVPKVLSGSEQKNGTNIFSSPRTFERIYMGGVPNKELDLSLLEPNKAANSQYCRENETRMVENSMINWIKKRNFNESANTVLPRNLQSSPGMQVSDNIVVWPKPSTAVHNIPTTPTTSNRSTPLNLEPVNDSEPKTPEENKDNVDSPTIKDLISIVKLQNEQLQLLQKQIDRLMESNKENANDSSRQEHNKSIETQTPKAILSENNLIVREKHRMPQKKAPHPSRNHKPIVYRDQKVETSYVQSESSNEQVSDDQYRSKVSVGLMTSFEVCLKSPIRNIPDSDTNVSFLEPLGGFRERQNKKQMNPRYNKRSVPNESVRPRRVNETDYSLMLTEPLHIPEAPVSPTRSIHIDMQEYDSDSDDESSTEGEPGWTFYNNILGQVNNLLKNSPSSNSGSDRQRKKDIQNIPMTDRTIYKIKQATVQCLQHEGTNGDKVSPSEVSFAVKQLLMKYLSDDQLANAATVYDKYDGNGGYEQADGPRATVKYRQSYDVIASRQKMQNRNADPKPQKRRSESRTMEGKILDITALKQQPKLT